MAKPRTKRPQKPRKTSGRKAKIHYLLSHVPDDVHLQLKREKGLGVTFEIFLLAGAVPPYSSFLLDVLRYYGIRLAHLTPHTIIILSIFSYICHQYLGKPPSLDLLRSYYFCRASPIRNRSSSPIQNRSSPSHALGSCHLHLRAPKANTKFIHISWRPTHCGWMNDRVYINDGRLKEMAIPSVPAEKAESWTEYPAHTPELAKLQWGVAKLHRRGLTGAMVMRDVIQRGMAPLRQDMWMFPGETIVLKKKDINEWMFKLFGDSMNDQETSLPRNIRPKIASEEDDEENVGFTGASPVIHPQSMNDSPKVSSVIPQPMDDATAASPDIHSPVIHPETMEDATAASPDIHSPVIHPQPKEDATVEDSTAASPVIDPQPMDDSTMVSPVIHPQPMEDATAASPDIHSQNKEPVELVEEGAILKKQAVLAEEPEEQTNTLKGWANALEERVYALERRVVAAESLVESRQANIESLKGELETTQAKNIHLVESLKKTNAENDFLEKDLEKTKEELQLSLSDLEKTKEELQLSLSEVKRARVEQQSNKDVYTREMQEAARRMENLRLAQKQLQLVQQQLHLVEQ